MGIVFKPHCLKETIYIRLTPAGKAQLRLGNSPRGLNLGNYITKGMLLICVERRTIMKYIRMYCLGGLMYLSEQLNPPYFPLIQAAAVANSNHNQTGVKYTKYNWYMYTVPNFIKFSTRVSVSPVFVFFETSL